MFLGLLITLEVFSPMSVIIAWANLSMVTKLAVRVVFVLFMVAISPVIPVLVITFVVAMTGPFMG